MCEGHSRYDRPREPVIVNLGDAHGAAAEGRKEAGGRPRDTGRTGERSGPGRTGENGEGEAKSKAGGGGRGRSCRAPQAALWGLRLLRGPYLRVRRGPSRAGLTGIQMQPRRAKPGPLSGTSRPLSQSRRCLKPRTRFRRRRWQGVVICWTCEGRSGETG